jgi:hypothetical protein
LRGLIVDPATALVVVSPARRCGPVVAGHLLDHPHRAPPMNRLLPRRSSSWACARTSTWLARRMARPQAEKGDAQVWMAARKEAWAVGLVSVRDAAALAALERPLPHYGRQSWLVLEGSRVIERGTWPAKPQERRLD